jgi:hypothetical protein
MVGTEVREEEETGTIIIDQHVKFVGELNILHRGATIDLIGTIKVLQLEISATIMDLKIKIKTTIMALMFVTIKVPMSIPISRPIIIKLQHT